MPKLTISEKDQNSCNKRKSGKDLWENREQREPNQQSMLACRNPLGSVDGVNNSRANSASSSAIRVPVSTTRPRRCRFQRSTAATSSMTKFTLTHYRIIEELGAQRARHRRGGWFFWGAVLFFLFAGPAFSVGVPPLPLW